MLMPLLPSTDCAPSRTMRYSQETQQLDAEGPHEANSYISGGQFVMHMSGAVTGSINYLHPSQRITGHDTQFTSHLSCPLYKQQKTQAQQRQKQLQ